MPSSRATQAAPSSAALFWRPSQIIALGVWTTQQREDGNRRTKLGNLQHYSAPSGSRPNGGKSIVVTAHFASCLPNAVFSGGCLQLVRCNTGFGGVVGLSDCAHTASRIGNDLVRGVIDDNWTLEIGHCGRSPIFLTDVVFPLFSVEILSIFLRFP